MVKILAVVTLLQASLSPVGFHFYNNMAQASQLEYFRGFWAPWNSD
jgi:hypothetical protein